jgi:hypothetical protein
MSGNGKKNGRPRKWTPDYEQVEKLSSVLSQDQMADYFGIAASTFRRYMRGDDDLTIAYKKGRAKALSGVGASLLQKARGGNLTAMIFYLKTQGGWRETEHHVVESAADYEDRVRSQRQFLDDPDAQKIAVDLYERLNGIERLPALPFSKENGTGGNGKH